MKIRVIDTVGAGIGDLELDRVYTVRNALIPETGYCFMWSPSGYGWAYFIPDGSLNVYEVECEVVEK